MIRVRRDVLILLDKGIWANKNWAETVKTDFVSVGKGKAIEILQEWRIGSGPKWMGCYGTNKQQKLTPGVQEQGAGARGCLCSTQQITGPQSTFGEGICQGGRALTSPQFDNYHFSWLPWSWCGMPARNPISKNRQCEVIPESLVLVKTVRATRPAVKPAWGWRGDLPP